MIVLAEFHFIRPFWLLLLPVVLVAWWIERRAADPVRGWRDIVQPELLSELVVGPTSNHLRLGLLCGGVLAVISVAGPTWKPEASPFADDPAPVMMILRAGESMDTSDMVPHRMERARLKVADFANLRNGLPTGLVAYAGSAHLVLPPTRDTAVVATMASEISPEVMPKAGDELSAALSLAVDSMGETGGSLVVVTDTVDRSNQRTLAEFRRRSGLPIFILAIARAETSESASIQQAAAALGASLTVMTPDSSDVESLVRQTARAPVAVSAAEAGTRWTESGWWLVPVLAVVVLLSFRRERQALPEEESS